MGIQYTSHNLEGCINGYRTQHPTTAEMDIAIFRAYRNGRSAVQISMEIPCAESTVYRALRRVEAYIEKQHLSVFTETLRRLIATVEPEDSESVLILLHKAYRDSYGQDQIQLTDVARLLGPLHQRISDPVIDRVASLCRDCQETSFIEGVKVGVRMIEELKS